MEKMPLLTQHAKIRTRTRFNMSEAVTYSLAKTALNNGLCADDVAKVSKAPSFNTDFIRAFERFLRNSVDGEARIVGRTLFVFHDNALMTAYQVPQTFQRLAYTLETLKRRVENNGKSVNP